TRRTPARTRCGGRPATSTAGCPGYRTKRARRRRQIVAANLTLNERALRLADHVAADAAALRVAVHTDAGGARVLDCGVAADGGLQAGLALARVCLAGLADVSLAPGAPPDL